MELNEEQVEVVEAELKKLLPPSLPVIYNYFTTQIETIPLLVDSE